MVIIIIIIVIIYFYHLSIPSINHIKLWLNYDETPHKILCMKYYTSMYMYVCMCMFVWLWYTDTKAFSYWPIYLILAHCIWNIIFIFILSTEICSVFLTVNFSTVYTNNETDVFVYVFVHLKRQRLNYLKFRNRYLFVAIQ